MLNTNKVIITLKSIVLLSAFLVTTFVWYVDLSENRDHLMVAFLNVGQGDAIFIEAPNGNTMLIDGGPDRSLLRELSKEIPFYKHSIGVIMITNPDADHFAGFIDLLQSNYSVGELIEPGTVSKSATYKRFEQLAGEHQIKKMLARKGTIIMLDRKRNIHLDILFPDKDVLSWKTNDGSVVAKLVYGDTSVMLEGDAPSKIEKYLISQGDDVKAQILKLGHHGSKTSTSDEYVKAVSPQVAIISAGLNNHYGFPHKQTLETLAKNNVKPLITFDLGTIESLSDSHTWKYIFK